MIQWVLNNDLIVIQQIRMDKLKEIMALKKPKDKVVINKNVIEQQKQSFVKQLMENKKAKQEEEQRRLQEIDDFYGKPKKMVKLQSSAAPPISVEEVKEQLRKLYQPATLFGQNAHRRYDRLMRVKKFHDEHPNEDMKLYDEEFIKKIKQNEEYEQLDAKYRDELIEPKILGDVSIRKKKEAMVLKEQKKTMVEMCDKIYLWLNKMIKGWGQSLEQKYQNAKINKSKFQLLEETTLEIESFIQVLKERTGDQDMIESIYHIMNCCILREYVQANSRYIELSIGSAPWPMGVAMLGITVRRNSERLSYVLDNQMTRKWMQAIKRLISVSQQLYPNEDRMKMVGYTMNSLA